MTEAFHTLPLAGGLFDQPGGYITRMEAVLRATAEQSESDMRRERAKERADNKAREMVEE